MVEWKGNLPETAMGENENKLKAGMGSNSLLLHRDFVPWEHLLKKSKAMKTREFESSNINKLRCPQFEEFLCNKFMKSF
jgi:hypothetical protein